MGTRRYARAAARGTVRLGAVGGIPHGWNIAPPPADARAREVEQYFADQLTKAETHEWSDAGQVLVIDNRRALRARSSVATGTLAGN
jgi:hypothetical protein